MLLNLLIFGSNEAIADTSINNPTTSDYIMGLDISRYQHKGGKTIDFVKMAAGGVKFVYINGGNTLASGDTLAAKYYAADRSAAQVAGLATGFYYFVHFPNTKKMEVLLSNADNQASKVIQRLNENGQNNLDLPLAVDVETLCTTSLLKKNCQHFIDSDLAVQWLIKFNADIYTATKKSPLIYSYLGFINKYFSRNPELAAYPLWVGSAGIDPKKHPVGPVYKSPCRPNPWIVADCKLNWTIWQYTANLPGANFGISTGGVDADLLKSNSLNFPSFDSQTVATQ